MGRMLTSKTQMLVGIGLLLLLTGMQTLTGFLEYSSREMETSVSKSTIEEGEQMIVKHENNIASNLPDGSRTIRKWGCDRTETPLIFVHNGKMGGGGVRARLAAAAIGYNRRARQWRNSHKDESFYPLKNEDDDSIRKGKFCNNYYPEYTQIPDVQKPFVEAGKPSDTLPCTATTPFGIAIGCPHPYSGKIESERIKKRRERRGKAKKTPLRKINGTLITHYVSGGCQMCDDDYYLNLDYYFDRNGIPKVPLPQNGTLIDPIPPGHTCDIVYTSHNSFGSELSWLPPRYLKEHWWDNSEYERSNEKIDNFWASLLSDRDHRRNQLMLKMEGKKTVTKDDDDTSSRWCPGGYSPQSNLTKKYDRPVNHVDYINAYPVCGKPLAKEADKAFSDHFFPSSKRSSSRDGTDYSPFYASMPLHRITMFRDPWTWLVSKFFWHKIDKKMEKGKDYQSLPCENFEFSSQKFKDPITGRRLGWLEQACITRLVRLCGNDCLVRWERGMMTLEEVEAQTESNLRNAFSVVGLLNETDSFYEMVTDRIDYVNLTLNENVSGDEHKTTKTANNIACKKLYSSDKQFQNKLRESLPAFRALERIFLVAVEVNRFQQEELRQCRRSEGRESRKGYH